MSNKSSDIRAFFTKPVSTKQKESVNESNPCSSSSSICLPSQSAPSSSAEDVCGMTLDLGDKVTGPCRPILQSYPLSQFKNCKRAFSSSYFQKYNWIEYSLNKDAVFCYPCRQFPSDKKEQLLTDKGLSNWKKINEKLEKHGLSESHRFSMTKWMNFRNPTETIMSEISTSHRELVTENREYLKKILDLLLYLARQGMPFRGHDETSTSSNKGNFLELCDLFSKYDSKFKEKYERYFNLTCHDIQNEILEFVKQEVLNKIVSQVNETGFFALMVDEAKSHKAQQLCICIRYMAKSEVKERLLTMNDVSCNRSAESLANIILNYLKEIGITATLIGQSHDGANVMSGVNNGLQKIIRDTHPFATYVHCMAHRVNLVLVNACESNTYSCYFFNTMQSLYQFFSQPDTHAEFKSVQEELKIQTPGPHELHKLSETRWSCRVKAVQSVERNFKAICSVLDSTAKDLRSPKSSHAKGLLSSITSENFIVSLIFFLDILTEIHVLSKALQRADSCIAGCANAAKGTILKFESKRNEYAWVEKWKEVEEFGRLHSLNIFQSVASSCMVYSQASTSAEPQPKRPRMITKKMDDYFVMTTLGQSNRVDEKSLADSEINLMSKYRCDLYYPVLEFMIKELKRRFTGESLEVACGSEEFLRLNERGAESFINKYSVPELDKRMLKAEIGILKCFFESHDKNLSEMPLKDVIEVLIEEVCVGDVYPNFKILFKICLTLPSNSATCERSFSTMRRINNWLRSTMSQDRFSNLMILCSESDIIKNHNVEKLMDSFAQKNRKIALH